MRLHSRLWPPYVCRCGDCLGSDGYALAHALLVTHRRCARHPRVVLVDRFVGSRVANVDLLLARVTACQIALPSCECAGALMAGCIHEIPTRGLSIGLDLTKDAFPSVFFRRVLHQAR